MAHTQDNLEGELKVDGDEGVIEKTPHEILAEKAVTKATRQLITSTEFKKPRMSRIAKYWTLYDGKTPKKFRQLFNVAIPVFPGMIDTLNAQHDEPIQLKFKEGDPSDYFKAEKINGAFQMQTLDVSQNSKWESKLRMIRKHAIMTGRGIVRYTTQSDPEYKSELSVVNLKHFHFQPRGGGSLEKHLFAGEEDIEKTESALKAGVKNGIYNAAQVEKLIDTASKTDFLPESTNTFNFEESLSRFKPLGLDPDNNSYVGEPVHKFAQWILNMEGQRYLLVFHPWTQTWIRFEKWKEIDSSGLYPWKTFATHEDDENFLSKSYADDLYPSADAIVAMFNQELTNREKRNFGARAYDKEMFKDVRKLDEAMHRPDALVPAETLQGSKRISEGIYEFKTAELGGTVNLIDWITGTTGRSTGANDLAQGAVAEVSKKASVVFAEQKAVSKRLGWASQPFQEMMASLGKSFIYGLKDHMPAKMAIRLLGEKGVEWGDITRLDLDTTKDVDIVIISTDKQALENEMKAEKRVKALELLATSTNINTKKRDEEILKTGGYSDEEVAEFMDVKTYSDKKSLAHASIGIQDVLRGKKPEMWFGATVAFMQKIVDYSTDNRVSLGVKKHSLLIDYAVSHREIVAGNIERKVNEQATELNEKAVQEEGGGLNTPPPSTAKNPDVPGGISRALEISKIGA